MNKILVVDDQKIVCYSLQRLLQSEGYDVSTITSSKEALKIADKIKPSVIVMDVRMPGMDGIEVLKKIKETQPKIQVIMMTAFSTTEKAIQAIKLGAYEYLLKPFDNNALITCIKNAIKAKEMMEKVVFFKDSEDYSSAERIIGKSTGMLEIYKQIGRVAPADTTVLITGESGTGKELIARAIYNYSKRANKSFLTINCAAIPEQLLESELFGYERGAFTGADFKRIGKFEQYNGGTIFLDEIGDMSTQLQSKLLRVLQDGSFQRLGGTDTIKTDVRIIAATNKNLEEMVKKGTFREDLYYRLNVVRIDVPPLRERKEDIKEIVSYFIQRFNKKLGKDIKGITTGAIQRLEENSWPGNVRELENTIEKTMVFCNADYLSQECCEQLQPQTVKSCASVEGAIANLVEAVFKDGCVGMFQDIVNKVEKNMIRKAMELAKGNQVHAARLLGISRNTLRRKLGEDNP
ncbi:MAG: sigma-54-dependent Fis family transcriptional regulator [Nitrospirae bacterium]|nr:sigma-54-dependent Fis family transcriptional regulator [Nitrospirota bacterium]